MRRSHLVAAIAVTSLALLPLKRSAAQAKELTLTANPEAVAHFRLGWQASDLNNQEQALRHFKLAIDADPNFGLARAMYRWSGAAGDSSTGSDLKRAVADAAKGSTAELLLTMALREGLMTGPAASGPLMRAAAELVPTDPAIAMLAYYMDPPRDGKAQLAGIRAIAAKFPAYAPAFNGLAYSAWNANDHAAGLEAAATQVKLLPKNPNSHDTYAELLQWSGNYPEALMHYQQAFALDSGFVAALEGMADVETLQGHYDKARGYINQAIARSTQPGLKLVYMRDIVGIYGMAGDRKSMEAQLIAVANEAKSQGNTRVAANAYSQLAASSANGGKAKVAHDYLALAYATDTAKSATVGYYATMTHGMLKHWAPAMEALAAAKAAPDARQFAARISAAEAYLATSQGKPADAIALLASADLTDPIVAGRLAEAYLAAGRVDEAAKLQRQIVDDKALVLADFGGTNARARARAATTKAKKK